MRLLAWVIEVVPGMGAMAVAVVMLLRTDDEVVAAVLVSGILVALALERLANSWEGR